MQHAIQIRRPAGSDGSRIWTLVRDTGVLDLNSAYCYLMLETYFPETCAVAESNDQLLGFVTGFIPPNQQDTLFIWQIAVDESVRGKGIAGALIHALLARPALQNVRYIEATISPSNVPSTRLFQRLAKKWNAQLSTSDGFHSAQFPDGNHEEETRYRIGPLYDETTRKEFLV